jgi:hypothetical protein
VLALFRKLMSSITRIPSRTGSNSSNRRQTGCQSHVACVIEMLERLVVLRIGDPRQHGLHRLVRTVAQALQIAAQRRVPQAGTEAASELLERIHIYRSYRI